jgi:ApbE superfamily uncharacterized protein (UPF0280 family)
MIRLIKEGLALVDSGPLYATIMVSRNGGPLSEAAIEGAQYALKILEQLANFLPVIKKKALTLKPEDSYPKVVKEMISAVRVIDDPDFTPLAAVAGATSDMVADYLLKTKATKIIVNNGGDIAIRLREGHSAIVGLRLNLTRPDFNYNVLIERDCGICTSGIGGRSFTLGVADGVTVVAHQAAIADAAATFLGNRTVVTSPKVKRVLAESIYPDTDLVGVEVTHSVGALSDEEIDTAMNMGKAEALRLMESSLIYGAVISVKDHLDTIGYFVGALRKI